LSCFAIAVQSQSVAPSGAVQWEYLVAHPVAVSGNVLRPQIETGVVVNDVGLPFVGSFYQWLNATGSLGWELTQIVDGTYIFKRPKS
jgi:hypothetical protein